MLKPLLDGSTIPLLEKVAVFGERRHEVLAGNIANIDTPNYKTRDLPVEAFQKALRNAVAQLHSPFSSSGSKSNSSSTALPSLSSLISPTQSTSSMADMDRLFPDQLFTASDSHQHNLTFQDANNRSVEAEFMEMTKNNMMQNFAVELMNAQMGLLTSVIREQA